MYRILICICCIIKPYFVQAQTETPSCNICGKTNRKIEIQIYSSSGLVGRINGRNAPTRSILTNRKTNITNFSRLFEAIIHIR